MWNPVFYVSCKLYYIIFLRLISWLVAGCCLISGILDNHWNILDELTSMFIPSSSTGFPGCGHKMIAPTGSHVPLLWSRLSWDDPRRGRQRCRGDQFPSQSHTLEPDSTVCRRALWKFGDNVDITWNISTWILGIRVDMLFLYYLSNELSKLLVEIHNSYDIWWLSKLLSSSFYILEPTWE